MTTRRNFIKGATAVGTVTFLPFRLSAAGHGADQFATASGHVSVHPVAHASVVLQTPAGVIYVDPVGDAGLYADLPAPDLVLITHEHGDHFNTETLGALVTDQTALISNPAVYDKLPAELMARTTSLANGDTGQAGAVEIAAIPAHNTTPERMNFHPVGRDNGYVITVDGLRIYVSGDTEGIPEMRALENIDVAFVCMNLPFTMDITAAASAVAAFAPTYVYPYHYRGRDGGTQDPAEFAALLTGPTEVKLGNWYS
ncbi:L-ascorbate metabolism protein UlaG, beta-lactamase superfamily [Yoonia tamlensis]|uniref:L-ascorbate metabolism protein UlaG, beta-lactamase superfamily n=1 Tax=Yoonia tamlensis TaxID=390270 RepID=A0A1I6G4R6_9RHOB|nr:MBL fold metallo-hydrolase [Yoonia tamlensis]SFR37110.1 L-ascorbate metabolism protein UlaG, beta-lactamase superfamily [Yoonia tamlensis]